MTTTTTTEISALRLMVRGAYDLQALRMQTGLRLCANFRSKLKVHEDDLAEDEETGELGEAAKKVLDELKKSYRLLCTGVAKNRTIPAEKGFTGDHLISAYSELILVDQYVALEGQEDRQFRQMQTILDKIPIYTRYLANQKGIGPAMAGVLISYFDPHKARHASQFWKYGGLDVASDGFARSRRQEHLVEREYTDREGDLKTRQGVTFNPFLRAKLLGVLSGCFLRSASPWRSAYDGYKHRIESDPARVKVTLVEWKRRRKAGEDVKNLWTPGRVNNAAKRFMVKMFVAEFWEAWRRLEGLPTPEAYATAKLGMAPHGREAA
jgi:hypothetical protein